MFISNLKLFNFRSYRRCEVSFSKGINIITGSNNSGKTTILKSLYALQSGYAMQHDDIRATEEYFKINVTIENISEQEKKLFFRRNVDNSKIAPSDKQVVLVGLAKTPENYSIDYLCFDGYAEYETDDFGKVVRPNIDSNEAFSVFPKFPTSEAEDNFIYPFFAKRKSNGYSSSGGASEGYEVNDTLRNLPLKIQRISQPSNPQFKEFQKCCQELLGFDIGTMAGDQSNSDSRIGIFVTNKHRIFLESMGEGVANILGLISILLTEDNKLFLIEELENDIHPEVLKKLLNLIIKKSEKNQFIISTHSNIVVKYLASIPSTKLFYTQWNNSDPAINDSKRIPTSIIEECVNTPENRLDILTSLGYDLFDFDLYSTYLIFEESSAERIIRDFLIPTFTPNLYGKVRTIAAKGANDLSPKFNDFHRLFLYIHMTPIYRNRAWVLADGDEAGRSNIEKLKEQFETDWDSEHFINFQEPNFERYYPDIFQNKVSEIMEIKDRKVKQERKEALLREVINWAFQNPEDAKVKFAQSASEIIDILKKIRVKILGEK